ncbi:hypothetical protein FGE12_06485 [Aggregicoccus sp. 17bor-14]|uniref:hypothetical protein n=1 Tax=Myxococcaceae TaxID=31 RepID=UPI00129C6812|nr:MULTISPECIES: hypothetical protein [Myxococcaceae]MBF5042035.1 hypothetical protein [Simulacricoccus sp. 17bor-14]MRI87814.1 hypothetical protein [Aggregicoccus sp. 17bor-14]
MSPRPPLPIAPLGAALLLLWLAAACGRAPGSELDPRPARLVPARGVRQLPVPVRIEGENFQPVAVRQLSGGAPVRLDQGFQALLGDVALQEVEWVDARTLRAQVPAGLAPGLYPLTVVGPLGRRVALKDAYRVTDGPFGERAAALVATLAASPPVVSEGQLLTLTLQVQNTGDATALSVEPGSPALGGSAGLGLVSGPTPASASVAGGASQSFRWTYRASTSGTATLQVGASGTDATDGHTATAASASASVAVQPPASLAATLSSPGVVGLGDTFTVTLTVRNDGGTAANAVAPSALQPGGTATATRVSGPAPTSATLPAGASQDFTWRYTATTEGSLSLSGSASGTDANSGGPVTAASTATTSLIRRATEVASDPFGDGTRFSYVFRYDGRIYLGPNKSGSGGVRMLPDGSGAQSFAFSFPKDTTSHFSINTSSGPFPSIGRPGCTLNTSECGPDNETGRGLFFTGTVNGQEWLTATGTKAQDWNYLYMTPDKDDVLDFRYVDLNTFAGGQARGLSAARFYANSLYLGVPDTTGNRPGVFVLRRTPDVAPGLDVPNDGSAQDLALGGFEYFGGSTTLGAKANPAALVGVDAMAELNGMLYLANNGGCVRTTRNDPRPFKDFPGDWATCRPTASAYTALTSITLSSGADLEPADRAVPALVPFGGRLYMARNTTSGPQLFACSPGATGAASDCDAGDWSLVAPNSSGDARLTQFDTAGNTRLTLLAATASHLYVGFNNADNGLVLFRTSSPTASARSDFRGLLDCPADQAPGDCQGLGQNGLGVGATRIFDSVALGFDGKSYLFLTAGTGTSAVRVFRIAD